MEYSNTIIKNAKIYTINNKNQVQEALVVKDEKNNKRPDLNDLIYKETALANADTILLLYRDSYYYPTKKEESKSIAEIIVYQKHNYNESSVAKLAFDANIGKFENIND